MHLFYKTYYFHFLNNWSLKRNEQESNKKANKYLTLTILCYEIKPLSRFVHSGHCAMVPELRLFTGEKYLSCPSNKINGVDRMRTFYSHQPSSSAEENEMEEEERDSVFWIYLRQFFSEDDDVVEEQKDEGVEKKEEEMHSYSFLIQLKVAPKSVLCTQEEECLECAIYFFAHKIHTWWHGLNCNNLPEFILCSSSFGTFNRINMLFTSFHNHLLCLEEETQLFLGTRRIQCERGTISIPNQQSIILYGSPNLIWHSITKWLEGYYVTITE